MIRFPANRFIEVLDGPDKITFLPINSTTIVIGFGIVRFQGNRFVVVLDC